MLFFVYIGVFGWATYTVQHLIKRRQLHHTGKFCIFPSYAKYWLIIRLFYREYMTLGLIHCITSMVNTRRAYGVFELLVNFSMMLVVVLFAKDGLLSGEKLVRWADEDRSLFLISLLQVLHMYMQNITRPQGRCLQ